MGLKEGLDYSFVISESDKNSIHLSILDQTSKFKDVVFKYGAISIKEENDEAVLEFFFEVITGNDEYSEKELQENNEFKNYIGNILLNLITEGLDNVNTYNEEDPLNEN